MYCNYYRWCCRIITGSKTGTLRLTGGNAAGAATATLIPVRQNIANVQKIDPVKCLKSFLHAIPPLSTASACKKLPIHLLDKNHKFRGYQLGIGSIKSLL
jgi:hypothetical protein